MSDAYLVQPDMEFIKDVAALGGGDLKKCFQCATCSVVCPISPDTRPFPRKEMIAASWGLKDKLVGNADIWLCHNCGDCSTKCPRGAKPGDVLSALRAYTVAEYAVPKALGKAVNDPKKLPFLMAIPAAIFLVIILLKSFLTPVFAHIIPIIFHEGHEAAGVIAHSNFIPSGFVDIVMVPTFLWAATIFVLGLKRFIADIHANALLEGKTDKKTIDPVEFGKALLRVVPTILKHDKFNQCTDNRERSTAHMMVLFGFIGLFVVTSIFFIVMYVFGIPGPYSQLNPVKWLANISGVALIVGSTLMIKNRLAKKDSISVYKDWALLGLALGLGVTGLLTEMTRLGGMAWLTYLLYYIHLIFIFCLFAYLPFSKLAHLVYRTVAMTYAEYGNRK
jgi:quinone-modifying oxidoreductase subunit QmoC